MSSAQPFTNYIQLQYSYGCNGTHSQMTEVLQVIQGANRGLLLIGAIHREDDIWAALLLAKKLSWPVVADVLSGLRLRKYSTYFEVEGNLLFIDHLDHSLLSDSVRSWAHADVIVQVHFSSLIFHYSSVLFCWSALGNPTFFESIMIVLYKLQPSNLRKWGKE